jgi:osmotically-inducible protein OsmY
MLNTGEVGNRIAEIVSSVEGVKDVVLRIEWFDPYP